MDQKTRLWNNKKWLAALCGTVAVLVLGVILVVTAPDGAQAELYAPNPTVGTTVLETIGSPSNDVIPPTTQPPVTLEPNLQPIKPLIPPQPWMPETALPPEPTFLEYNTMTRKDFAKVNGYITCKATEAWLGVDVSVWQEDIDWERVAQAGVKFAMVRVGFRGWGWRARLRVDSRAQENLDGAAAAGLKVGAYFYSQATSVEEAIEEARFLLEFLDGRHLDMPVVFDWEVPSASGARTRKVKAKTIHACAMAFCAEIEAGGYQPMVYFNQWQGKKKYNLAELREAGYELWLAMYTNAMTYEYKVQMWQYTSDGRVPGIDGRVDIDLYFPEH